MPRNGDGTFNRVHNWQEDAADGITIDADRMDAEFDGIAEALTNSIAADGQTEITANLPMSGFKHTGVASATEVDEYATLGDALTINNQTNEFVENNFVQIYESKSDLESSSVPAPVMALRIQGYASAGDGGGALYKRVGSEPSHAGKIQSADGAWWEIADGQELTAEMFGILSSNARSTNDALVAGMLTASREYRRDIAFGGKTYNFSDDWEIPERAGIKGQSESKTILDFEDSNGLSAETTASGLNSFGIIRDIQIRGNAATSSSSAATQGIRLSKSNYWRFINVWVRDFCHNITLRGDEGFIQGFEMDVRSFSTRYPNSVNGYPNTLFRIFDEVAGKPQVGSVKGILYAQIMTENVVHEATASQTDFTIDWSADKDFDIFKASGIHVGILVPSNSTYTEQILGTDYDLYVVWDSVEYEIPPGTEYVRDYVRTQSGDSEARAQNALVRFTSGLSAGEEVRIKWNDPTANYCLYNDIGTGFTFDVQIGGANRGVYAGSPDNHYLVRYAQFVNDLFYTTGDGDRNKFDYIETQGAGIYRYLNNTNDNTGIHWARKLNRKTGNVSSETEIVDADGTVVIVSPVEFFLENPLRRFVTADIPYRLESSGNSARALLTIERSETGTGGAASWTGVGSLTLENVVDGSSTAGRKSDSAIINVQEDDVDQGFLGRTPRYNYRIIAETLNVDTTLTILAGGLLRIEEIQPE